MRADPGQRQQAHQPAGRFQGHTPGFRPERDEMHACAQELVEGQVAFQDRRAGSEVEQMRLHAQLAGRCGGQAGVVGLQAAKGNHFAGFELLSVGEQVFQLAGLVPAQSGPIWSSRLINTGRSSSLLKQASGSSGVGYSASGKRG
jgi:hypothetical protein